MTTATRTGDDEGRIVQGGELPEDDSTLDDVVVEKPEELQGRKIILLPQFLQSMRNINENISLAFLVDPSQKGLLNQVRIGSSHPYKVPSNAGGKVNYNETKKARSGGIYHTAQRLDILGYKEGLVHRGEVLGPDYYMKFLYDLAAGNNCEISFEKHIHWTGRIVEKAEEDDLENQDKLSRNMVKIEQMEMEIKRQEEQLMKYREENMSLQRDVRDAEETAKQTKDYCDELKGMYTAGRWQRLKNAISMLLGNVPEEKW